MVAVSRPNQLLAALSSVFSIRTRAPRASEPPTAMAEVHIVGQLTGGDNFELPSLFCKWTLEAGSNFRLLEGLTAGQTHCDTPNVRRPSNGRHLPTPLHGARPSLTCCARPQEGEAAVWAHPIDVHYALRGIDGWPRLLIEVYGVDIYGRCELGAARRLRLPPRPRRATHHSPHRLPHPCLRLSTMPRSPPITAGYGHCTIPTTIGCHTLTVHTWRPYGTLREQISSAPPAAAHTRAHIRTTPPTATAERGCKKWQCPPLLLPQRIGRQPRIENASTFASRTRAHPPSHSLPLTRHVPQPSSSAARLG